MKRWLLFIVLLLTGWSAVADPPSASTSPTPVLLTTKDFSVNYPPGSTLPAPRVRTRDGAGGSQTITDYSVVVPVLGGIACQIVYYDYPAGLLGRGDPKKILSDNRDGRLGTLHGSVVSQGFAPFEGHPALSYTFTGESSHGQLYGRVRELLVGDRLYEQILLTHASNGLDLGADFFDSFKLLR